MITPVCPAGLEGIESEMTSLDTSPLLLENGLRKLFYGVLKGTKSKRTKRRVYLFDVVVDDLMATTATCPEGVFRGDSKLHVFITADGTDWGVMQKNHPPS